MNERRFDFLVRHVAINRNRRSLLGVVMGAVLAGTVWPVGATLPDETPVDHPDFGKKSWDKKGGKKGGGKKGNNKKEEQREKQQCRKQSKVCLAYFNQYCLTKYEPGIRQLCGAAFYECCQHYLHCRNAEGDACIAAVGY